ncbi:MAG: NAD(P)-binding protein [Cyclobacteriaceae bacterium]|nr:GMC family oxidoreductase [Cyclobacteriaceae bacterium]MCH8515741.1 NAD(P)-binding protein [Cyclobacteriaceae bacterium]
MANKQYDYDYVIIGSGFGGSVSALRLSEKGYKVLVIEKGKWFKNPSDFPKTNWNLRKWLWLPKLGLQGFFKLTLFRHVGVLSGVGVGGGSLVYANTLPVPKTPFFKSGSWAKLADWQQELAPFYQEAKRMLGASAHPYESESEKVMRELAEEMKKDFDKTDVAVYFGEKGKTVADPYFGGKGPSRTGCIECGACMTGCRYNAKNTLDKNYLYLAQQLGCEIMAEREVYDVVPLSEDGSAGYRIKHKHSLSFFPDRDEVTAKGVIFAGGVLGTMDLLLKLKETSLPRLSEQLGRGVRTNSESLIGVTAYGRKKDFSKGIAIGSIVNVDENRHVEPVKYSEGSGFWRMAMAPMVSGSNFISRLYRMVKDIVLNPIENLKIFFVDDYSKRTQILLYMESIDSTLRFRRSKLGINVSSLEDGNPPTAFNPVAQDIAKRVEKIIDGKAMVMSHETLLGIPSTAHILGGACMGADASEGVINSNNEVFGYQKMLICDGSMISANIGVNPSLSITAITERAMSNIPKKEENSITKEQKTYSSTDVA